MKVSVCGGPGKIAELIRCLQESYKDEVMLQREGLAEDGIEIPLELHAYLVEHSELTLALYNDALRVFAKKKTPPE